MKAIINITGEGYSKDIQQLWRNIKRFRNAEDTYADVKFTLKTWAMSYDGAVVKENADVNLDLTEFCKRIPEPPTNGDLLTAIEKAGGDVSTTLPALVTGIFEVEYTPVE